MVRRAETISESCSDAQSTAASLTAQQAQALLSDVAGAARLREGPEGVRAIVSSIFRRQPLPLRDVAVEVRLPLPVVVAVTGELVARKLVERTARGVTLTREGKSFAQFLFGEVARYRPRRQQPGSSRDESRDLAEFLGDIVEKRPAADVTLDQTKATGETLAKRILYLDRHDAIAGRRVLCLGDDDFVAVAATRWVDWVARTDRDGAPRRLTVMEIDPRICSAISALAPQVETLAHDLRNPLPDDCRRAFDVIVTDPPYTPQGAELFLSRAAEAAAAEGAHCFFSFGHLDPTAMLAVQSTISRIGWVVVEWLPAFNQYEGSSVLAGVSLMAHLVASDSIAPTLSGAYEGALYTGDLRPMIRTYRCVGCCAEWEVGPGKHWPTVQDLKSENCPLCGCERFTRRGQRPAEIA